MPQPGGPSDWSIDSPDEEERKLQQRFSDLTVRIPTKSPRDSDLMAPIIPR
jgi:hypothetical protein